MLLSATSAAWTVAALALRAIGAVVWPLKVSVNVPAFGPVSVDALGLVAEVVEDDAAG